MKHYNVYFTGEAQDNISPQQLKKNLCTLFKADMSRIEKMFTGKPVMVKKSISAEQAKKYKHALLKAGAKIIIKEVKTTGETTEQVTAKPQVVEQQAPVVKPAQEQSTGQLNAGLAGLLNYNQQNADHSAQQQVAVDDDELTLQPPNTGSLEEFSRHEEEFIEPDLSNYSMSEANSGSLEEFAEKIEFEEPDLSGYSMSEANSGSLEEFAPRVVPVEIKDTSYMDITDQNDRPLSDQTPKPDEVEIPDISGLSMSEPESGDLRDFAAPVEPAKIKDISNLKLEDNPR